MVNISTNKPKFGTVLLSKNCRKTHFCFRFVVEKYQKMANLTLTILPAKALKGGRHKVRIAVAHNGTTRYILTDVVIDSTKEFKNGQIVKRSDAAYLNTKLRKKLVEVQQAIDDIPYIEGLSCPELIDAISSQHKKKVHTLRSAFEEMIEVSSAKETSKSLYRATFSSISRYIPESTRVRNITPVMLKRYIKKRDDIARGQVRYHIALIAMVLNHCQRNGYTDYTVLPTTNLMEPVVSVRQNWLTPDEVRFIRDNKGILKSHAKFRDLFMLSYYLGGINLIDLARINFNECADTLYYIRTKTERKAKVNPFVEFEIPDEAKPIITKYKGEDGKLLIAKSNASNLCHCIEASVHKYREHYNMPQLTFYSARKSFAQHAFNLGISESVIDYILGHSLGSSKNTMLYSYIKVTPEMATDAVRKVCDFIASDKNF